ncbi:MAG: tripartite tricarboxylate transporter TctB family protein, partial [Spirochaetales bacterium]
ATLLAILSLVLMVQSVTKKASSRADGTSIGGELDIDAQKKRRKRVQLTFLLILLYLILLEPIGFLITTTLYLFFQFWVLSKGKPKLPLYGIIAILTSLGVYYLFVRVFILFLPPGILG